MINENKKILKAIQNGTITRREGIYLLKHRKNIPLKFWSGTTPQDKKFFDLLAKCGIDYGRIEFV